MKGKIFAGITAFAIMAFGFATPAVAAPADICKYDPGAAICQDPCFTNPDDPNCAKIENTLQTALNFIFMFIGALALGMIIWSGIRMMIFHDGSTKTWGEAKKILITALIALVISSLALVIVNLTMSGLAELGARSCPGNQKWDETLNKCV